MVDVGAECRVTLAQIQQAIETFPQHMVQHQRRQLLLDRAAQLQRYLLKRGARGAAAGDARPPPPPPADSAAPVAVDVTGKFARQKWVPVAESVEKPDASVPTTSAIPVVAPLSLSGAGTVATAAMRWKNKAQRGQRRPPEPPPVLEEDGAPPIYRESLEQLDELRDFRRSLEDRMAAYGLEHDGRPPDELPEEDGPVLEELDGDESSDGSIREFLSARKEAAMRIQRTYRGRAARRRLSQARLSQPAAPADDLVVEDLDTVQLSDEEAAAAGNEEPKEEEEEEAEEYDSTTTDSPSSSPTVPPQPKRPVGRWAGGAVGTGAAEPLTRFQRPKGKLKWVASVWAAFERCAKMLENSQAIKASTSVPDEEKRAEFLFIFRTLLPPMTIYFGSYFKRDRAEVEDEEKRRILSLATRLLRGVHGLCHPPPGAECEVTEEDTGAADVCLHQMLENGLRSARPLSAGHNSAIERDARRGAARLREAPPEPPTSYARVVQQLLQASAHVQPALGADEGGGKGEVDSDEEAAMAADRLASAASVSGGEGLDQVWKGGSGGWAPVDVASSPEPDPPAPATPFVGLTLDLNSPELGSPSSPDSGNDEPRKRRVNVGEGGSTPKEVRVFIPSSSDEEAAEPGADGSWDNVSHAWEILAGGCALDASGHVLGTETLRGSGDLVGLYFGGGSSEWACRSFEEEMRELYEAGGCAFEVLSCSTNLMETEVTFLERNAELPWRSLPYGDPRPVALAKLLGIEGSAGPVLVFINQDGECLSTEGCAEVRALLHDWRVQEAVLEGEAGLRAASIDVATDDAGQDDQLPLPIPEEPRPTEWHERGEGALFGAFFAFRRGLQLGGGDEVDADAAAASGAGTGAAGGKRLAAGMAAAESALPPGLLARLPCTMGSWTAATRTVAAGEDDDLGAEGGRALLLQHTRTGMQLAVWEDSPGFYFRLDSTGEALCLGPQCSVPTPVDQLRESGGAGAPLLSDYDVFTPTLPSVEEFAAECGEGGTLDPPCGSWTWGEELHIPNDSTPWVLSAAEDGSLLLADHGHQGGGALFLAPDGGVAFGSETATALVRASPALPMMGWTQRRLSVLLDRARELAECPDGFGAFGSAHAVTQGLTLDPSQQGLLEFVSALAASPETAVDALEMLPARCGRWALAEIESEEGSARLAFVHDSGARLVLAEQGGVHYRYAGTTHWERWFSDAGWQVRVAPCPSRQAVLLNPRSLSQDQSGSAGRRPMPEEDELAPAQFAAQSSATPVLPAAGRLLWGEEAAGAGWGLLLEEGGMTISHVGGWLRAWMFGQRCAPPAAQFAAADPQPSRLCQRFVAAVAAGWWRGDGGQRGRLDRPQHYTRRRAACGGARLHVLALRRCSLCRCRLERRCRRARRVDHSAAVRLGHAGVLARIGGEGRASRVRPRVLLQQRRWRPHRSLEQRRRTGSNWHAVVRTQRGGRRRS